MKNLVFISLLLIFLSCKKDKGENLSFCDVSNPIEELSWLKEIKEGIESWPETKGEIHKCISGDKVGFMVNSCVGCADNLIQFFDCEGNVLCEFGGYAGLNTCPDFNNKLTLSELIWTNK